MQEWKIKVVVEVLLASAGALLMWFFPDCTPYIIVFTALAMILVVLAWPVEEEVEESYYEPPAMERIREALDRPQKELRERFKKAGFKTKKVKRRRWFWD